MEHTRAHVPVRAEGGPQIEEVLLAPDVCRGLCEALLGLDDEVGNAEDGVGEAGEGAADGGAGGGGAGEGLEDRHEDNEPVLRCRLLDEEEAGGGAGGALQDGLGDGGVARRVGAEVVHDGGGVGGAQAGGILDGLEEQHGEEGVRHTWPPDAPWPAHGRGGRAQVGARRVLVVDAADRLSGGGDAGLGGGAGEVELPRLLLLEHGALGGVGDHGDPCEALRSGGAL
mmetsp:Transcript_52006/g.108615  ORF Transcript_52006/g.108615 Transcript_52006/m.108615 type:complete len:227 (-) Transcript_52006:549-1229(-)